MRDPKRIDDFCNKFAEMWKKEVPDWRFGQLICNMFGNFGVDSFFLEEDNMLKKIEDYFNQIKGD